MTLKEVDKVVSDGDYKVKEVVRVAGGLRYNVVNDDGPRTLRVNKEELPNGE